MKYQVGIPKIYFPRSMWPRQITEFFEVVEVVAESRVRAARIAWDSNCDRWLRFIVTPSTSIQKISLYVNNPKSGNSGLMGRLDPIPVFSRERGDYA